MAYLIDKDDLLAEIDRRIKSANNDVKIGAIESLIISKTLNGFKSFLNILEVKEVDLEKELSYKDYIRFFEEHPNFPDDWGFDEAWVFAKHFFELGIAVSNKTQKGK